MLEKLGATPLEDMVYRHLVGVPALTVRELAGALDEPAATIVAALEGLAAWGLVLRDETVADSWMAEPPDAVESLLAERERDLREVRRALAQVAAEYRSAEHGRSGRAVEFASGAEAIRGWMTKLYAGAKDEVVTLVRPPYMAVGVGPEAVIPHRIPARVVYDRAALEHPEFLRLSREHLGPDEQLRVHPSVPMKLIVFDRSVALLPFTRPTSPVAAVILAPGVVEALYALFDHIWQDSTPLVFDGPSSGSGPLTGQDSQLLSCLLAGLTDEAIARELGITVRTVGRRVRQLMDTAGVNTRIQLGWQAARRGWLATENDRSSFPTLDRDTA